MASVEQMLSPLQCGSTQRDGLSRLGVERSDLQRLQSHQHHHQLLPRDRVPSLSVTEISLQSERGPVTIYSDFRNRVIILQYFLVYTVMMIVVVFFYLNGVSLPPKAELIEHDKNIYLKI